MGASMSVEGGTDAAAFEAYVEHFLAPTLREGQVVVLDGLSCAHRTDRVRELIEQRGEPSCCSCLPTRQISTPSRKR
jgi:transposase